MAGKEFLGNSPIFKKWYGEWVEKLKTAWAREQARGIEQMRKAQTERRVLAWLLFGAVIAYSYWANNIYPSTPGAYCDYPDPFGQ